MTEIADVVQTVAAVVSAIMTLVIAWMVHDYTVRRDKVAIIHEMWKQQQEWNLTAASSPAHMRAQELMVYGGVPATEDERNALNSCMFFFINRINHIYDASCLKILSREEFERESKGTVVLLAGQKELLFSLLDNRGYDREFAEVVKRLAEDVPVTGSVDVFAKNKTTPSLEQHDQKADA